MTTEKMKVEIWSDITCPFCYIGKRNLETALSQFKNRDNIGIVWKSFELAPGFTTLPDTNMHQFLAELKGISLDQSIALCNQVAASASEVGLVYHFHRIMPTNSYNAHRLIHLAKKYHLQDKAKENLLKAYFTDGRNIDDIPTLITLGTETGLDQTDVKTVLEIKLYTGEVNRDIAEAKQRGITSVPQFVFNNTIKASGAQNSDTLLEMLEVTYTQWLSDKQGSVETTTAAQSCSLEGGCN